MGHNVKESFQLLDEYGAGTKYGNKIWWGNLFLTLKLNDYINSTQIKNGFGSVIGLSQKSKKWLTEQKRKYNNFNDLVSEDELEEELLFEKIENKNEKVKKLK